MSNRILDCFTKGAWAMFASGYKDSITPKGFPKGLCKMGLGLAGLCLARGSVLTAEKMAHTAKSIIVTMAHIAKSIIVYPYDMSNRLLDCFTEGARAVFVSGCQESTTSKGVCKMGLGLMGLCLARGPVLTAKKMTHIAKNIIVKMTHTLRRTPSRAFGPASD